MQITTEDLQTIHKHLGELTKLRNEVCFSGNTHHRRSIDRSCSQIIGAVEELVKLSFIEPSTSGPRQQGPKKTQKQSDEHKAEHALAQGLDKLLDLTVKAPVELTLKQQQAFLDTLGNLGSCLADCGIFLSQGGSKLNMTSLPYAAQAPSGMNTGDEAPMKYVEGFEPSNRGFFVRMQREREKLERSRERE
jgi:hypothetical protein